MDYNYKRLTDEALAESVESTDKVLINKDGSIRQATVEQILGTNLKSENGKMFDFAYNEEKDQYGYLIDGTFKSFSDATALYEALQYSGLVTEDMSYDEMLQALADAYPPLPIGTAYSFAYTGSIKSWTCECTGLYKLEVYGAQGGTSGSGGVGGEGGYSIGYKKLNKGDILYIAVGGTTSNGTGGYNGGGSVPINTYERGGGGATHIATMTGILSSLSSNKDKILIVAGGGGGSAYGEGYGVGGTGGGSNGGSGSNTNSGKVSGGGGSQTGGGTSKHGAGSFGQGGGHATFAISTGGGGGYYGGGAGYGEAGGGGGSGYIGGVPSLTYKDKTYSPSTANGNNSGNGKAVITFVAL